MKKNVLIFIDWFLPGTKAGGPVRSMANLTEQLSDHFCFWIVTSDTDYCETSPYKGIAPNTWVELQAGIQVFYASGDSQNRETFASIINDDKFDSIYINGIYSYKYSILPLQIAQKSKKKIVVAPRGMFNPQAFSSKSLQKRIFLSLAKLVRLYNNVTFHATNEEEKKYCQQIISGKNKVVVAPNLPRKIIERGKREKGKAKMEIKLVNIARVAPEKGTIHMFEHLKKVHSNVQIALDIYGPIYNSEYWEECLSIEKTLNKNISVTYKGAVEGAKIPELLENYHAFYMPTEGENFGHAILEALSAGCPVIISDQTPWRNLEKKNVGWDIPLSNTEKFIEAIDRCASMDQEEYDTWSSNAFEFAKTFCEDKELIKQSIKLFED